MKDNIIHFPPQGLLAMVEAQEELDTLMADFDDQFNELLANIFTVCEDYPDYELFDPIQMGVGYASLVCSLGSDPEDFIGFRNIKDLCNEFGVDLELVYSDEFDPFADEFDPFAEEDDDYEK